MPKSGDHQTEHCLLVRIRPGIGYESIRKINTGIARLKAGGITTGA